MVHRSTKYAENPNSILSSRAAFAHEYYGHMMSDPSPFDIGDWSDEFKASYRAALDTPNLSNEERRLLMLDAYERASNAGVRVRYNKKAKEIIYGAISATERKVIDLKFKFPKRDIVCPRCGKPLRYIATDSAEQVKCESNNCIKVTIRGI